MKLDADAAVIPSLVRCVETNEFVPPAGAYLENCKYDDHGYFSNLEVHSLRPFPRCSGTSALATDHVHIRQLGTADVLERRDTSGQRVGR